ncbi:hypothetical protein ACFU8Q_01455 [Streptomyces sp. NPDC057543]|uniref:hypothetical protein n=1 Tax=Streptomyces sp. NPDC057543 TaxID=3346163 RepID=UPI0036AC20FF
MPRPRARTTCVAPLGTSIRLLGITQATAGRHRDHQVAEALPEIWSCTGGTNQQWSHL